MFKFEGNNFTDIKNKFIEHNSKIETELESIYNEFINIDSIINTPKSNKVVPKIIESLKNDIDYVRNYQNEYISDYSIVIRKYSEFNSRIKELVGDNNDK